MHIYAKPTEKSDEAVTFRAIVPLFGEKACVFFQKAFAFFQIVALRNCIFMHFPLDAKTYLAVAQVARVVHFFSVTLLYSCSKMVACVRVTPSFVAPFCMLLAVCLSCG